MFVFILPILILGEPTGTYKYTSTKGITLNIKKDNKIPYMVTRLEINIPECKYNPYLPYLNLIFMFNEILNKKDNLILSNLKKIGKDYKLELYPDKIIIKNIFLKRKLNNYIDFIHSIYSYNLFSITKLNKIKSNFNFYLKTTFDYDKVFIQNQIFSIIFDNNSKFNNTISDFYNTPNINLVFLKSFYKKIFKLSNSTLYISGHMNPHLFLGQIENRFKNFRNSMKPVLLTCENRFKKNNKKNIHFIKRKELISPNIYMVLHLNSDDKFIKNSMKIINHIIFGTPSGRLFKDSAKLKVHNLQITTSYIERNNFLIITNKIKTNKRYINKLIKIINLEFKYILINKITRKEYLETLNFFYGDFLFKMNDPYSDIFFTTNYLKKFFSKLTANAQKTDFTIKINNISKKIFTSKLNLFSKILLIESSSYFSLTSINNNLKLINIYLP